MKRKDILILNSQYDESINLDYYMALKKLSNDKKINLKGYTFRNLFFDPLILFRKFDKVIYSTGPSLISLPLLLILFVLRKDVIYHTSWPFWNREYKNYSPNFFVRLFYKFYLNKRQSFCVTRAAQKSLQKVTRGEVTYVPHCIDMNIFNNLSRIKSKKIRFVYAGQLRNSKGIKYMLKLFDSLNQKYDIEFNIAGKGPEEKIIKEYAKQNPNFKYYSYVNSKKDMAEIYKKSDIFLSLSYDSFEIPFPKNLYKIPWTELFGISLAQAMACGVIPVVTNCVGPKEIVRDLDKNLIIKQRNFKELYKIINILLKNKEKINKLSKESYLLVQEKYEINKVSSLLSDILNLS